MKKNKLLQFAAIAPAAGMLMAACNATASQGAEKPLATHRQEDANIKMYGHVWYGIINKRRLELFDDSNFTKDLVMHTSPADVVGIDSARAYYANYLTGCFYAATCRN